MTHELVPVDSTHYTDRYNPQALTWHASISDQRGRPLIKMEAPIRFHVEWCSIAKR